MTGLPGFFARTVRAAQHQDGGQETGKQNSSTEGSIFQIKPKKSRIRGWAVKE